jgi:hypothetical protein
MNDELALWQWTKLSDEDLAKLAENFAKLIAWRREMGDRLRSRAMEKTN